VGAWAEAVESTPADEDLDRDRVGVFWALLFLSSQGNVELEQSGGLYGPLSLRRRREEKAETLSLPPLPGQGSDRGPALEVVAA
jgi:segregation and condensation protein A